MERNPKCFLVFHGIIMNMQANSKQTGFQTSGHSQEFAAATLQAHAVIETNQNAIN